MTLLLEPPSPSAEDDDSPTGGGPSTGVLTDDIPPGGPDEETGGLGFVLRAPGLVLLAAIFVIEGYQWLGVLHLAGTTAGSLVFGTAGLALMALLAPLAVVLLTSGHQKGRVVTEDSVIVAAVTVTVATGTSIVVGGTAWHAVAGSADLLFAAVALGAVFLGERARRRGADTLSSWSSAVG
jgi:hypothetical protein